MNNRLFLIVTFCLFTAYASAQMNRQVQGKLTDSSHSLLPGIPVQLVVPGTKETLIAFSQTDGTFRFSRVTSSHFNLSIKTLGFDAYNQSYHFAKSEMNIRLDAIKLIPTVKTLQEVIINIPPVLIKEDTVEYKAGAFKVSEDAVTEELLKKLPGIQVNKNGMVTAQGKPVTKVKVNGKDFFGGDVKTATRELPANIVDKVQVIDDYGDEAAVSGIKTGNPNKVINLQLKKEKEQGFFGKTTAGYGTERTYQAAGSVNFFNGRSQLSFFGNSNNINNGYKNTGNRTGMPGGMMTLGGANAGVPNGKNKSYQGSAGMPEGITTSHTAGANYRIDFGEKNSFYGSYNAGQRNTEGFRDIHQQFFYPSGQYTNAQGYQYNNRGNNHQAYLNLEMFPDSLSYLKISPRIYFNRFTNSSSTDFTYFRDTDFKASEGNLRDNSKEKTPDFGINILYNRSFRKRGRNLSVSLNQSVSSTNPESIKQAFLRAFETSGSYQDSTQLQKVQQDNRNNNYSIYFAYTEPLANNRFIDLTYFHSFSKSSSDRKTFLNIPASGMDSLLSDLSNQFSNRFVTDRLGVNFRTVKKKYNYTLGMSILPVNLKNYIDEKEFPYRPKQTVNFSPLARFSGTLSRFQSLVITYNGNSRQPVFQQLQPVRDISDIRNQREGNPDLKPEFFHTINLSINSFNLQGNTFFAGIGVNSIQHKIINNIVLLDSNSGAQLTRPENTEGFYGISGFYNYSKPWKENKYVLTLNGSLNYHNEVIMTDGKKFMGNNWFILQELILKYTNNKGLELGAGINYCNFITKNLLNRPNRFNNTAWTLNSDMRMNIPGNIVLNYDFEYIVNRGLVGSFNKNISLLNASIEKKILKKNGLYASISGYNILNQNSVLNRQVIGNSIFDIRSRQLTRYFLLSFTYRWNKFGGQKK